MDSARTRASWGEIEMTKDHLEALVTSIANGEVTNIYAAGGQSHVHYRFSVPISVYIAKRLA